MVVYLDAARLYDGLQAKRVQLLRGLLALDTRNWNAAARGEVVTDVIDLGGGGVLSEAASVSDLRVTLDASPPQKPTKHKLKNSPCNHPYSPLHPLCHPTPKKSPKN